VKPEQVARQRFVRAEDAVAAFTGARRVNFDRFRADLDAVLHARRRGLSLADLCATCAF
jgi:hypothetical protein